MSLYIGTTRIPQVYIGGTGGGSAPTPTITLQTKSATPTTSSQTITPDAGYDGLSSVAIAAIPSQYIIPNGNKAISANGTNIDVAAFSTVSVSVTPNLQTKSVTLSETAQTITPDSSYDGLSSVSVPGISSTYIGSAITQRNSNSLTVSGATVTAPAGYYASSASKSVTTMTLPTSTSSAATSGYSSKATISRSTSDQYINIAPGYNSAGGYYKINAVPNGSVTAPSSISGTSATISTGTNTVTFTKSISVTPNVTTAGYISSGTAGNSSVSLTASVTTKAAATITPGTTAQTIASGTYLTGTQTISGDANLVASNILSGVSIFGVAGNVEFVNYSSGTAAPTSSLGNNGDLYLELAED